MFTKKRFSSASPPLEEWDGKTVTTAKAAQKKGYTSATIARWCRAGLLDYMVREGRFRVCVDAAYDALPNVEDLRKEVRALRKENARLEKRLERLQMRFDFVKLKPVRIPRKIAAAGENLDVVCEKSARLAELERPLSEMFE